MSDGSPIKNILSLLSGIKPSGDSGKEWMACCPAHDDDNQSLKVTEGRDDRVLLTCYAACDTKDILRVLGIEYRDLFPGRVEKPTPSGVSVESLARDKRVPSKFLRDECGLTDQLGTGKKGARQVLIPYRDEAGEVLYTRFRSALKASEGSSYQRGTEPRAYGLWRLPKYRTAAESGPLILVEGESDSWSLWLHDYPALGIPGADAVKVLRAEEVVGFDTIYIWRDADGAGAKFVTRMAARLAEIAPGVTVKVLSSVEAKDPNQILRLFGEEKFRSKFDACLATATDPKPENESDAPELFAHSDIGNAQRLVAAHGNDIRYAEDIGQWYVWDGHRWRSRLVGPIIQKAIATVRMIVKETKDIEDPEKRQKILVHAGRSESARAIKDMVKLAESNSAIAIEPSDIDSNRFLLNVKNGTIDLRTGELRAHRREDLLTKICPIEYDSTALCPTWKLFIARLFANDPLDPNDRGNADMIQFVKRLLGYSLTGDIGEQVLPIFWGGGSNGKSTLLNVVRELMGRGYAAKAPRGLLMQKHQESHPTELTVLFGARLVIATESKRGGRLSEDLVKDLTGDEAVSARYMKKDFFEFEPTHKLILCTNHRPRVPESDDGIWRRVLLVPFKTKFWNPAKGEAGPDHLCRDNNLKIKLRAEYPGILAWLVRGCREWQKYGLGAPTTVQEETAAYREEEDKVAQYLSERCEISNANWNTPLKDVYADYCRWCEETGYRHLARNDFAADLRGHNIVVKRGSKNKMLCFGFRLIDATSTGKMVSDLSDLDD